MADWSRPSTASLYAAYTQEIRNLFSSLVKGMDGALIADTNVPTNAIRWNVSTWERFNGTVWNPLCATYTISISGSAGSVAWGNITGRPTFPSGAIVGTTDSQTLTNKTFDATSVGATQSFGDSTTKLATTAFVDRLRDIPQQSKSTAYQVILTDRGQSIDTTSNVTIPTNASVAFPIGSTISGYNNSAASITVAAVTPGTTTLRLAGTATTGTRTVAQRGIWTMRKVATDEWVMSGAGVS